MEDDEKIDISLSDLKNHLKYLDVILIKGNYDKMYTEIIRQCRKDVEDTEKIINDCVKKIVEISNFIDVAIKENKEN